MQPGFRSELEELTPGSSISNELLAYAAKELETDKLYYLLRAFLGTQDDDERMAFLADLEGDFVASQVIKKSYKTVTGMTAKFNQSFSKTKHAMDYFYFTSHLFKILGYDGWVILLDEAELIGRLGKKTRMKTYRAMQEFLNPGPALEKVFTLFSFSSSYAEDVIDKRHEFENVKEVFADQPEDRKASEKTLNDIIHAPELLPLTRNEIRNILLSIEEFHGSAYDWNPEIAEESIYAATQSGGYLLRTQIRAAIEFLDQLYQYGEAGKTRITELGKEVLEEEDVPKLF